jgi:hypothetical protein
MEEHMNASSWFEDLPVLGALPPEEAAGKLRALGDDDSAERLEDSAPETLSFGGGFSWPFQDKPWQHTAHAFGYLAPVPPGGPPQPIQYAGNIAPDLSLQNGRIKITLDRLRAAEYPGKGEHQVLFDFYAQNQSPQGVEHLHFNATHRVREGEQAAVIGYPLFVGLNVGPEGVVFKCFTVNVSNKEDEAFLGFLDSDAFKGGLKLAATIQPAIGLFSETALGLTRAIASRNRNAPVQDFYMGLDFSNIAARARLAEGSYLAVQIPESLTTIWDWSQWVYNPNNGQVVNKDDMMQLIPYNYIVFSVSRYAGD